MKKLIITTITLGLSSLLSLNAEVNPVTAPVSGAAYVTQETVDKALSPLQPQSWREKREQRREKRRIRREQRQQDRRNRRAQRRGDKSKLESPKTNRITNQIVDTNKKI